MLFLQSGNQSINFRLLDVQSLFMLLPQILNGRSMIRLRLFECLHKLGFTLFDLLQFGAIFHKLLLQNVDLGRHVQGLCAKGVRQGGVHPTDS